MCIRDSNNWFFNHSSIIQNGKLSGNISERESGKFVSSYRGISLEI